MKPTLIFLLVALSCCFELPAALLNKKSGKPGKPAHHGPSVINRDCLQELLKRDAPGVLLGLRDVLCLFSEGAKDDNSKLYRQFLSETCQLLKDAGCVVDDQVLAALLGEGDLVEGIAEQVGQAAHDVAHELLVLVEQTGLAKDLYQMLCQIAGEILTKLGEALSGLNLGLNLPILDSLSLPLGLGGLLG